ncbi:MAG TPA: GH1 family beta-glucosidase [Thermoanaerobaculia bacterium]|nr:GH1 family beta-glucosidase [Thermoanaerobaculia bacterium]
MTQSPTPVFPDGFLWGAATSAYQIEGSPLADGAGPSNWHRFTHTPGLVPSGETGDVACDHYRRYAGDVELMRGLGLNAYRFSVSWSRVLPQGRGQVSSRGLDFYRRLIDSLLAHGIRPVISLYHWDLPAALDDRGGWLNRDSAEWFADYARLLFKAFDDRVEMWATINEPWVVVDGGYLHGVLAPGHRSLFEAPIVLHHLLRAHGAAVEAYRADGRHAIGVVVNIEPKHPASDSPEDVAAAARAEGYMNRLVLDPVVLGSYPAELPEIFGEAWLDPPAADLEHIRQPLDFLGINYYTRGLTRHDPQALPLRASNVRQRRHIYTETGWEVYPQGLAETLLWCRRRYGPIPLYVTENGAAFYDPPAADGPLDDPLRVDYLRRHLRAAADAMAQGVDLRGYFVWSLLDNFEWTLGYSKRFGIVHVDYETQQRTPKASARFYSEVIRTRGASLAGG